MGHKEHMESMKRTTKANYVIANPQVTVSVTLDMSTVLDVGYHSVKETFRFRLAEAAQDKMTELEKNLWPDLFAPTDH